MRRCRRLEAAVMQHHTDKSQVRGWGMIDPSPSLLPLTKQLPSSLITHQTAPLHPFFHLSNSSPARPPASAVSAPVASPRHRATLTPADPRRPYTSRARSTSSPP
jgi:hypothetical protein